MNAVKLLISLAFKKPESSLAFVSLYVMLAPVSHKQVSEVPKALLAVAEKLPDGMLCSIVPITSVVVIAVINGTLWSE